MINTVRSLSAPTRDRTAPAASSTTTASGSAPLTAGAGGAMGKDQFVKLLVTEMKNQDPMNPMDGKELAVQLAQFSSVEQLLNVNSKLDDLTAVVKRQLSSGATPAAS